MGCCTACCEDAKHLPSLEIRYSSDSPRFGVGDGGSIWGPCSTNFCSDVPCLFQVPWILHGFSHGLSLWKWPRSLTHCKALSGRDSMSFSAPWAQHQSLVPGVVPPWVTWWSIELLILDVQGYLFLETWETLTCCFFWGGFEDVVSTLKHVDDLKVGDASVASPKFASFTVGFIGSAQPHTVPRRPSWNSAPGRNTEL